MTAVMACSSAVLDSAGAVSTILTICISQIMSAAAPRSKQCAASSRTWENSVWLAALNKGDPDSASGRFASNFKHAKMACSDEI